MDIWIIKFGYMELVQTGQSWYEGSTDMNFFYILYKLASSQNFLCAKYAQKKCNNVQKFVQKKIDFAHPENAHFLYI